MIAGTDLRQMNQLEEDFLDGLNFNMFIDERSYDDILNNDLPPFEAGIESGAEAILVDHNIVKSIEHINIKVLLFLTLGLSKSLFFILFLY